MSGRGIGIRRACATALCALAVLSGAPDLSAIWHGDLLGALGPSVAEAQYGTSRRVARRTSRRTSARHNAAYGGYGYGGVAVGVGVGVAVPVGAVRVTALPAGCAAVTITGIGYHHCGSVYYRGYMEGDTVVYVEESPEQ